MINYNQNITGMCPFPAPGNENATVKSGAAGLLRVDGLEALAEKAGPDRARLCDADGRRGSGGHGQAALAKAISGSTG
jgi:hypothetical protein